MVALRLNHFTLWVGFNAEKHSLDKKFYLVYFILKQTKHGLAKKKKKKKTY